MMDEIRIWELARTEAEISNSYNKSIDPSTVAGLIGYWNFNETDQVITDSSSMENDGSLEASTEEGTDDPIQLDSTAPLEDCDDTVVDPVPTAPIANDDTIGSIEVGSSISFTVTENDTDANGDLNPASVLIVSGPTYGMATVDELGVITYLNTGGGATTDTLTYIIVDAAGLESNEATVTIMVTEPSGGGVTTESCGKGLEFDGINDWVNIPDLRLANDFTIEGWFKLAPGFDYRDPLFGQEGYGPDIHFAAGKVRLYAYGIRVTAKTPLIADTWGHIAITREGSNLTVYINGVKDSTGKWKGILNIKAIGRGNRGFVKGMMDEIRIWNITRTESEIGSSYDTSIDPSTVAGLIGYWSFNETNQIIADSSGMENHGTLGASDLDGTDDPTRLDTETPLTESCDDVTAPVISNIQTTVSDSTVTISWDTDEPATSNVAYGLDDTYTATPETDAALSTQHSVTITELTHLRSFYYQFPSISIS